jgi:hypothetical protein
MFTVVCAKRDFGKQTSSEVFGSFPNDEIVAAFRDRPLDAELGKSNLLHRLAEWRKLGEHGDKPGTQEIGKLTTEGWRAYLWLDDGSVYGQSLGCAVIWLFGRGQRYDDSDHRDFHHQLGRRLILDPTDSWRPTIEEDYPALFTVRAEDELKEGLRAVSEARDYALSHPNTVVPIELPRLVASIGEAHWEETVAGVVMDDLHFRYFVLSRLYSGSHEQVAEEMALTYADEAFAGLELWGPIGARDIMLEGLDDLSDADFYCYAADLGAQP